MRPARTPGPNEGFDPKRLDLACCVVDPWLLPMLGMDPSALDPVAKEQLEFHVLAARVKVRRIVAALNGVEIQEDTAGSNATRYADAPVLMERTVVEGLKRALLNEKAVEAVETAVGADEAAALLGALSSL